MKTRNVPFLLSLLWVANVSGQTPDTPGCKIGDMKRMEISYDDIKDETLASMIIALPQWGAGQPVMDGFLVQAKHAGKSSDSVAVPRVWVVGRMGSLDPLGTVVNVLIEDSVRYSWKSPLNEVPSYGSGVMYGMGLNPVSLKFLEIPPQEFSRLATADHASLAINGRRYDFKTKQLARFAAIDAWSRCLSARQSPSRKK